MELSLAKTCTLQSSDAVLYLSIYFNHVLLSTPFTDTNKVMTIGKKEES